MHLTCVTSARVRAGRASDPRTRAQPNPSHERKKDRDTAVATPAGGDGDQKVRRVDPKRIGLEIVLGEWAPSP